ncbi:MAG: type II secretion system F family protein [Acidobacteriia bacterium]|nr:type II secretion system F family protein [Terriglobia bacterium]
MAITVFLLAAVLILVFASKGAVDERLMEITAPGDGTAAVSRSIFDDRPRSAVGEVATGITSYLKPIRDLIASSDEDLGYRLNLAGLRKPEHLEIYAASKMLFPVLGILAASFSGGNVLMVGLIGVVLGFFGPDIVVTQMCKRRQESIRHALPDALDLLVICMEAGLGIDQAMVRVGEEIRLTSPALADEFQIINREQRAGKPRLDAWRSMAERVDIDYIRQFVSMLVQTERFGTPIANALGQFSDGVRLRRMQAAEEMAAKTGVKLLFPLVFFIFPSIFVVLLGPAVLNIAKGLSGAFK